MRRMTGSERREAILNRIKSSERPVAGRALAASYDVSRQVIVQDIGALREKGYGIIATNRGYLCQVQRVFQVCHTDQQIEDELNVMVDLGGVVMDVFVQHEIYGKIRAELNVSSRRKVEAFCRELREGRSSPLKNITSGVHYHTVSADSDETLEQIRQALAERGYLVKTKGG